MISIQSGDGLEADGIHAVGSRASAPGDFDMTDKPLPDKPK
jgi:hypothetical protein